LSVAVSHMQVYDDDRTYFSNNRKVDLGAS
jgi:hypothetical protein